ncbi:MAG TPA: CHAT domain-containing protein [Verrucomicrobiae bacterium]|nr:CHAT domain-containing protein [Verrucomicrobiae bacterium]
MNLRFRFWCALILVGLVFQPASVFSAATRRGNPRAEIEMGQGARRFEAGAFEDAARHWQKALQFFNAAKDRAGEIDAAIQLATAYESLGQTKLAIEQLTGALALAERIEDRERLVRAKGEIGLAYSTTRRTELAETNLLEALAMARQDQDWNEVAAIDNNLGGLRVAQGRFAEALNAFRESATLARQNQNQLLTAKALANSASAAQGAGMLDDAAKFNATALLQVQALSPSHDQAYLLILCGQTYRQLSRPESDLRGHFVSDAAGIYNQAYRLAEKIGDKRAASYALGYLGQLYEDEGRDRDALVLTRRAAFLAQQTQTMDALFRWEWQTARLLKDQDNRTEAITAYREAVATLQMVRTDLTVGCRTCPTQSSFRDTFGSVYFELADLLLQEADNLKDPNEVQQKLLEARDTVEQLKSVELEDYLQDECVSLVRSRSTPVENVAPDTAVLYLIPLPDRTEVLVGFDSGLTRFKVPVGIDQLTAEVRDFRRNLETRTTFEYLIQAQHLYNWLIRPIRDELATRHVQTLVFVPDGALRTIPLAALYDGRHFLVNDFAVAVSPGLTLTDASTAPRVHPRLLLAGLSQGVQGFSPLDYVPQEVRELQSLYRTDTLMNREFSDSKLKREFEQEQYALVHIASHAQFNRQEDQTYILTYDAKLTLNDLEGLIRPSEFRGRPVELLTLSACQTAAGDDRAALGLAGVAVKAGARSALATLWFVNDEASTVLVSEFYSQWRGGGDISKARALQLAQQKMLADKRYRHPCYWAPYLVIGNWL